MGLMECTNCGAAGSRYSNSESRLCEECFEKCQHCYGGPPWEDSGPTETGEYSALERLHEFIEDEFRELSGETKSHVVAWLAFYGYAPVANEMRENLRKAFFGGDTVRRIDEGSSAGPA